MVFPAVLLPASCELSWRCSPGCPSCTPSTWWRTCPRTPYRAAAALTLLGLVVQLALLNQAPADPYFAQTLQTWEQGQFIRFHGVVQWLGWLWPYAALLYVLIRLSSRDTAPVVEALELPEK